jgi:hypothetical protein
MTKLFYLSVSVSMLLVMSILVGGQVSVHAADQFTLDTKSTVNKLKSPIQYKLVASANGFTETRITNLIQNPPSGTVDIPISIPFDTVNDDIVTSGYHDEYFVCGYVISSKTSLATKYKCNEGDLQDADGNNLVPVEGFRAMPKASSSSSKSVKIKVEVPLKDRPDADLLKVVAMVRGEFKSGEINAEGNNGKTVSRTFTFDRNTGIGPIQKGDLYFVCVAGDELNPPEGNECEFAKIKTLTGTNTHAAR